MCNVKIKKIKCRDIGLKISMLMIVLVQLQIINRLLTLPVQRPKMGLVDCIADLSTQLGQCNLKHAWKLLCFYFDGHYSNKCLHTPILVFLFRLGFESLFILLADHLTMLPFFYIFGNVSRPS